MKEYKIIEGTPTECQKWLNQWKNEFDIEILSMQSYDDYQNNTRVVILLTREKKNAST